MAKIRNAYIVGAGFSFHAGLPLQAQFTEKLLEPRLDKSHPDHAIHRYLAEFIRHAFDHNTKASAKYWPKLEDLFTCIDLSANSGHHLGFQYSPSRLRTVRRSLLTRVVAMLDEEYEGARSSDTPMWRQLTRFIEHVDLEKSAFISLNWDTVIEQKMNEAHGVEAFEYCCGAKASDFPTSGQVITARKPSGATLRVVKMHGSINWLYCDSCRRSFWFPATKSSEIAKQLLSDSEWEQIDPKRVRHPQWLCRYCENVPLGTRLATFSFRKALDFPQFHQSWLAAESILRTAERWIFIGYSLPEADYEFKYLLKRVQISRANRPEIVLVTGGANADDTYSNYQRFFGRIMDKKRKYFKDGLKRDAVTAITI
jgi:hypothetical protein